MKTGHFAKKAFVTAALWATLLYGPAASAGVSVSTAEPVSAPAQNANAPKNEALEKATAAAKEAAESPEMQKAVSSVWAKAWNASWPFIKSMVSGFFGLFVIAWHSATAPTNANGNANANLNASTSVN